jgi:hypothetical protein
MATLASAKAKYARRTAPDTGGARWERAKGRMVANYQAGLARFLGRAPAADIVRAYQDGIATAQYRSDPDKWERNFLEKMTGG